MGSVAHEILKHLQPLLGLKLSIARLAADLRNFHFGEVRSVSGGRVGEYALHIQCPWRIEGPGGIITGRLDLWEPAKEDEDVDWDRWSYHQNENLQDARIAVLLGGYDPETKSHINLTDLLVVKEVAADDCGGATITLSGGYRLVLFPAGTRGEDWRIFRPRVEEPHFVIARGKIELKED
jgi:hypothetical protein